MKANKCKEKRIIRLAAFILAVCIILSAFAGCRIDYNANESAGTTETEESNGPSIKENFEGGSHCGLNRGTGVVLETVKEGENTALKVSGRTETWNGVNFAAEEFRGNSVYASVNVKTAGPNIHLTLQYDHAGSTTYTWIASAAGAADHFINIAGGIKIPENASNIFIYVESDDLSDIYIDDLSITVIGEYIPYADVKDTVYADFSEYESLKDMYAEWFDIGCAIPATFVSSPQQEYIQLTAQQFGTITLENEFKPESILDYKTTIADIEKYNECPAISFEKVTETLNYCRDNNIKVRGHVLVWHSQTPQWLFHEEYDVSKELASRELMLKRMENYICGVLTWCEENYPDLFYAWDVVNEAVDDTTNKLRSDVYWTKTVGDDWVEQAFVFARKYAGEGVSLFYNDYNSYVPGKLSGIIELLRPVAEANNIDGIGMQGHINTEIDIDQFTEAAEKYVNELNVIINVTELDIEISKDDDALHKQGVYYNELFNALIAKKKEGLPIENVTLWGLCDAFSWKADKLPLLFNEDLSAKPAFEGVVCAAKGTELE